MGWFIVECAMVLTEPLPVAAFAKKDTAERFCQLLKTTAGIANEFSVREQGAWDDCPCCWHEPGNGRDR